MLYTILGGKNIIKRGSYKLIQVRASNIIELRKILLKTHKGKTNDKYNRGSHSINTIKNENEEVIFEYYIVKGEKA